MTVVFPFRTSCHRVFAIGQEKLIFFIDFLIVIFATDLTRLCAQGGYRSQVTRIEPFMTNGRDIKTRRFEQTLFWLCKELYYSYTYHILSFSEIFIDIITEVVKFHDNFQRY